jgi:hypothetical protein
MNDNTVGAAASRDSERAYSSYGRYGENAVRFACEPFAAGSRSNGSYGGN